MSTALRSRFVRSAGADATESSDSHIRDTARDNVDDRYPLGGHVRPELMPRGDPMPLNDRPVRCSRPLQRDDVAPLCSGTGRRSTGSRADAAREEPTDDRSRRPTPSATTKRAEKMWYNDSDEEEVEEKELVAKLAAARKHMVAIRAAPSDVDPKRSGVERPEVQCASRPSPTTLQAVSPLPMVGTDAAVDRRAANVRVASRAATAAKSARDTLPTSTPSMSTVSASGTATDAVQSTKVQTGGFGNAPTIVINRRTDRLKHSASGSEYSGSPRVGGGSPEEVLSPGPRKAPGAFPGRPGTGVLLEGWLRLKQRRGVKGLKKWDARYFVLHARSNEVRYYADVVQSAWGTIPLGELGSISLRLIQRIGKLSHPRYKGCHFDITCRRNTWGTHCTDDDISSDDEDPSGSTNVTSEAAGVAPSRQEKGGSTPRSTRVYSLVADSPQVTVAWVNMLDSLLTRSANSPRPETGAPVETSSAASVANVGARGTKPVVRPQDGALDPELSVLLGPGESVPRATVYAMNFIFDSTPGIETPKFYEAAPDATKLKAALKFLNGFAGQHVSRKPTKAELEELLDAVTAGAVIKRWLQQLQQPLVPCALYDDYRALAQTTSVDRRPKLCALLEALPKKNLTMLACLLFHLNDVNVYASKNGMDATRLAPDFTAFILRPSTRSSSSPCSSDKSRDDATAAAMQHLVAEMIINVDTFMDEKEAQVLEDNRL